MKSLALIYCTKSSDLKLRIEQTTTQNSAEVCLWKWI